MNDSTSQTWPTKTRPYAAGFVSYAESREDVLCLTGDLSNSCEADDFREAFPDRFINIGMAEQNLIGIAAGLTRAGLRPVVHTFGVFATRRALDQVHMSIGVPHAPVRIMGFLPGLTTPGGVTHQAIDDVAIMRAVPGMTVIDLGDATEIESVHDALDQVDGPVYCRVMRGDVPQMFDTPLVVGPVRTLRSGTDICLISSSISTLEAIEAAEYLTQAGVSVSHLHVATVKPLDASAILEAVAATRGAIVLENHLSVGGLGSAVAETVAEAGLGRKVVRLGLQDTYGGAGSQGYLFDKFGLNSRAVVRAAEQLLGTAFGGDLAAKQRVGEGDLSRQEAL
jgi:transketolase